MLSEAKISLLLYDAETGEKIKDCRSLNLNKANVGKYTTPVVIRMFENGTDKIENVKLGIVKSTETIVGSGLENTDGSVAAGNAGIEHGKTLTSKSELGSFFPGANTTESSTGGNLVSIDNMTSNSTEFIYLNTKVGNIIGNGYVKYKWFFDMV